MAGLAHAQSIRSRLPPGLIQIQENGLVRRVLIVLATFLAFVYPLVDGNEAHLYVANTAEVYVLLALGLNIVVGFAGLLDLGYAAFFAIGAYTAAMLASTHFSISGRTISNLLFTVGPGGVFINFFALIPIAAVVAAICGIMFGAPTLRLRGDYLAIVTLGFGEIVPDVVKNLGANNGIYFGRHNTIGVPNVTGGINNITGIESPPNINFLWIHLTFQTNDQRPWYYLGFIIIGLSVVVIMSLRNSRIGRCWVAIREDEIAAAHAGINITGTRLTAFALGASFSGFGGLLYATRLGSVSYDQFVFSVSVTILAMVILGGIGSIPGAIIGGIIIAYLTRTWLDTLSLKLNDYGTAIHHAWGPIGVFGHWLATFDFTTAKSLLLGIILVGIMLLRPQGLIPDRRRSKELRPATEQEAEEEREELYTVRTGEI